MQYQFDDKPRRTRNNHGVIESVTERVSAEDVIFNLPFFAATSYLLSCATSFVYDKLKKKNQ